LIDSKKIIYLPRWIKITIVTALFSCLAVSIYISLSFVGIPDRSDWILLSLSMAQITATALVISMVLIFGEREANLTFLVSKTERLLLKQLPAVLERIEDSNGHKPKVQVSKMNNIFGANYRLDTPGVATKMWVGFNVDRIIIAYFLPARQASETMRETFRYTFGGAESVGYKVNYEEATIKDSGERIISIWCTWPAIQDSSHLSTELLSNPEKKLFIIQDIAMMTQSFIRTAERNSVDILTQCDPGPL